MALTDTHCHLDFDWFDADRGLVIERASAQFSPRPECYFLFLYELTKYFPGRWTFVGAVLLPGLGFSLVLVAPFLDSGKDRSLARRKPAAIAGFGLLFAVVVLTAFSLL